jgi:hypothetical protein
MNVSNVRNSLFSVQPANVGAAGGVALRGLDAPGRSAGISSNRLIGLDAWNGASAAERSLSASPNAMALGQPGRLDDVVNHILAPLGG